MQTDGGAIVNIADLAAFETWPGYVPHSITKAGVVRMTSSLAKTLAPAVRVNAIAPGYITNATPRAMAAAGGFDTSAINRRTPLGRFGEEEEIAEGIAYLLDPKRAAYVSGHVLEVSGGWMAYGYT